MAHTYYSKLSYVHEYRTVSQLMARGGGIMGRGGVGWEFGGLLQSLFDRQNTLQNTVVNEAYWCIMLTVAD